jgi:citrate synthase
VSAPEKQSSTSRKLRPPKSAVAASPLLAARSLSSSEPAVLITAREAVRRLGVKPATLYAYVSRGLLRSAGVPASRERRYYAQDVERLKRLHRSGRRAGAPPAPFDAFAPVLDSAICLVENGRLYYRGIDAIALADRADLEETARLLWESETLRPFKESGPPTQMRKWLKDLAPALSPIERARSILVELATRDLGALDVSPESVARTGGRLVLALAGAITGAIPTSKPIHNQMATAWGLDGNGADLIRRCLVLSADHELNTSTYVVRCVASTAASPYAAVIAAFGTLSGPRYGGQPIHVETMLRELGDSKDIMGVLAARMQRGESIHGYGGERIAGFGHPLYPNGDPRAANVLDALSRSKQSRRIAAVLKVGRQISEAVGRQPNIDFALGAVSFVLNLPRGSAQGVWLVGRAVGWIAHTIEQYALGTLIRPRARYVGILPKPDDGIL